MHSTKRVALSHYAPRCCMALAAALALSIFVRPATAQLSCSAAIDPTIQTPPDSPPSAYFVGTTLLINVELSVGTIQGGSRIDIPELVYALDCFDNGTIPCVDEGPSISYGGDATIMTDCGVGVTTNNPPGGTAPNQVTFTFAPAVNLPAGGACNVSFEVTIEAPPAADSTPERIEGAVFYEGLCDNDLPGEADGTVAIDVLYCGDNAVNTPNETCDGSDAGSCNDTCRAPGTPDECTCCGDGMMQTGETCDDGNMVDDDGCRNNCTFCGDGNVDAGESCDDGNDVDDDDCRNDCTFCGDGNTDSDAGETCDDGNDVDDDDCRNNCTFCGDGVVDMARGEECDTGDANSNDPDAMCRPDCKLPKCGDGIIDPSMGETCDGPDSQCPNCRPAGDPEQCTCCGDGIQQDSEDCDGGPNCDENCEVPEEDTDCCLPDGTCVEDLPESECDDQGIPTANCLGDANGDGKDDACEPPTVVPTMTGFGMAALIMLLMAGMGLKFRRRS